MEFKDFIELKADEKPVLNGYIGKGKSFGIPNRSYKLYLEDSTVLNEDEEDDEKIELFPVNIRTKSVGSMLGFISMVSDLQDPSTQQLLFTASATAKVNDLLSRDFGISNTEISKLGVRDYISLISFVVKASSPR